MNYQNSSLTSLFLLSGIATLGVFSFLFIVMLWEIYSTASQVCNKQHDLPDIGAIPGARVSPYLSHQQPNFDTSVPFLNNITERQYVLSHKYEISALRKQTTTA
jgi:hypothetical protein